MDRQEQQLSLFDTEIGNVKACPDGNEVVTYHDALHLLLLNEGEDHIRRLLYGGRPLLQILGRNIGACWRSNPTFTIIMSSR